MNALKDSDWICKHCGSQDIIASVTIRRHELVGKIRERDGKPYFDEDTSFLDLDDFDVDEYICECGASDFRLEELVVRRRAFNEMRLPCGRCDHEAHEHPQVGRLTAYEAKRHTRPPMPCTVEGCDCHDYYDSALALEPNWDRPGQLEMAA